MAKYISLDNCLSFLENKCYYFLDSSTEERCKENWTTIFSKNDYHIIVEKYTLRDDGYIGGERSFDIGQVDRVHLKDSDKDKFAIIVNKYFGENTGEIKVTYKNLFHESKSIFISREYSNRTVSYLEEAFNNIEEKIKNSALKMFNFCEYFKEKDSWIDKIKTENRLEQIPFLSVEDIEYFHSKEIKTIEKIEDENICKKVYEDMPEGLKDKHDDIQEWLKNKDENMPACNHKYYLNWSEIYDEIKYAVNFEGHSDTDIVYAFSYQQMYLKDAKKEHIILEKSEKSKEIILEHYRNIVNEIYCLLKVQAQRKDIVFVTLALYARKNFEKVIETILEYKSEFDQETINKTLNVAEYFGFDYYLEGEAITYANPYVDSWIDLKNVIEKYICTGISVINSFTEVYEKLYDKKLDSLFLNSYNYSWALKPKYIKEMWMSKKEKTQNSQENLTADLKKQLDMKLFDINKLHSALYSKEGLLRNIMIYPKKREFTNDGSFMSRFMLKETISSIKEYNGEYAEYIFDRLLEQDKVVELLQTNLEIGRPETRYGKQYVKCTILKPKEKILEILKEEYLCWISDKNEIFDTEKQVVDIKDEVITSFQIEKGSKEITALEKIYITKSCFAKSDHSDKSIRENLCHLGKDGIDKFLNDLINATYNLYNNDKCVCVENSISQNKCTLLLGPPGTGKTYTIAEVVNALSKECSNKKFLVTGFTHLSIENCLNKIVERSVTKDIKVAKCDEIHKPNNEIKEIKKEKMGNGDWKFNISNYSVIGATVSKLSSIDGKFDYIIVDEASQMKIPEFLMTNQVARQDTHFLIVGDDNQLPPIIKNKYLNANREEILEAKSIFSYISAKNPDCIIRLNDCHRMNRVLCEYPEKKIYKSFKPATDEIANQKLELSYESMDSANDESYLFKILNPDYPIVLCLVDNEGVKRNCSEKEAQLCAEVSEILCKNISNKSESFWGENLAIVSPHHSHIKLIKNKLSGVFQDKQEKQVKNYFVDTVDKMQGQEADVVIVSYGVTDPQIAFKEKEFIYNRNRLNVSTTRARSKLIVLLSKELLDIDRRLMDDMELKEHIDFMIEYIEYLKGNSKSEKEKNKILERKDFTLYGIPFN